MLIAALKNNNLLREQGSSLIEVLVSMVLLSIAALPLTYNAVTAYKTVHRTAKNSYAAQVALEGMEAMASTDPSELDADDTGLEVLNFGGVEFLRDTVVTVNADNSRTVTITVTEHSYETDELKSTVALTNTFFLWGRS